MLPAQDPALPLPQGRPSARRGPWRPGHPLRQAVLQPGPSRTPATPEVPAFGLLHLLTLAQLSQDARGQGLKLSDLNLAHCAQGTVPGADRAELQANKVEKLPFQSVLYFGGKG